MIHLNVLGLKEEAKRIKWQEVNKLRTEISTVETTKIKTKYKESMKLIAFWRKSLRLINH